jgi:hypothetical protein
MLGYAELALVQVPSWTLLEKVLGPMLGRGRFYNSMDWRSRTGRCLGLVEGLACGLLLNYCGIKIFKIWKNSPFQTERPKSARVGNILVWGFPQLRFRDVEDRFEVLAGLCHQIFTPPSTGPGGINGSSWRWASIARYWDDNAMDWLIIMENMIWLGIIDSK